MANDFFTELKEAEEAPNIKYDQEDIKPDVIEQKKWDFIYKVTAFVFLIAIYLSSFFISTIKDVYQEMAINKIKIEDLEPVAEKMKIIRKDINYDKMVINQFLMESLFFTSDKSYEIIHKLKLFFEDPKVIANLGDFKVKDISIAGGKVKEDNGVGRASIKLSGQYTSYKDLVTMIDFLNHMKPVFITQTVDLVPGNKVNFSGELYLLNKKLIKYDYGNSYKKINGILKIKEEYEKNKILLDKVLEDKDLGLKKLGIEKIYNCKQYGELLKKKNLVKDESLKTCNQLEVLVNGLNKKLNTEFNMLVK